MSGFSHTPSPFHDPRMRGFRARASVEDVFRLIDDRVIALTAELVPLAEAAARVLSEDVRAHVNVPGFDRAAMDGYALRGEETYGSDAYAPAVFRRVGVARPGRAFIGTIGPSEAVEIATGAPLPTGADTVVPVEATTRDADQVLVREPVPIGRHVGRVGEDIAAGTVALPGGRVLRPQDLGVLSGLGVGAVRVVRQPLVTIVVTGDELLPPGTPPSGYRFSDMNGPMLAALTARDGARSRLLSPLPDLREMLREALTDAVRSSDVVLFCGGSSTGPEDHAPSLVAELGELPVHGVAVRPASPTGLGFVGGVPVVLLPGNPVSCLCAYDLFAGRVVRLRGGRPAMWSYRSVERPLAHKLVSAIGRVDYARVRISGDAVEPLSVSGASILSSATRADGFVLIPGDLEGYPAGATVTVWLYDR
jgi:molybdopterin molybdotransferase